MSCRMAMNMAKRAAAGVPSGLVWSDEAFGSFGSIGVASPSLPRERPRRLRHTIVAGFCVFAALSFVSYAAYAHQWSELSALRHLGKAAPDQNIPPRTRR